MVNDMNEISPEDSERAGELIGKLHYTMKGYTGELIVHDKYFFIDRYVEIMKKKQYPNVELFSVYGNELWEKIKNLPRGYCHCELTRNNVQKSKTNGETLYIVDYDTSCLAFPMYDITLFCNDTAWSAFDYKSFERSKNILNNFLPGYLRYNSLTDEEISAFYSFIAIFHFEMQVKIMEMYGYDCADNNFFDKQYDLLLSLKEQFEL